MIYIVCDNPLYLTTKVVVFVGGDLIVVVLFIASFLTTNPITDDNHINNILKQVVPVR